MKFEQLNETDKALVITACKKIVNKANKLTEEFKESRDFENYNDEMLNLYIKAIYGTQDLQYAITLIMYKTNFASSLINQAINEEIINGKGGLHSQSINNLGYRKATYEFIGIIQGYGTKAGLCYLRGIENPCIRKAISVEMKNKNVINQDDITEPIEITFNN